MSVIQFCPLLISVFIVGVSSVFDLRTYKDKTYYKCTCEDRWKVMDKMNVGIWERTGVASSSLTLRKDDSGWKLSGKNPGMAMDVPFRLGKSFQWQNNGRSVNVRFTIQNGLLVEEQSWGLVPRKGEWSALSKYGFTQEVLTVVIYAEYSEFDQYFRRNVQSVKSTCVYKVRC